MSAATPSDSESSIVWSFAGRHAGVRLNLNDIRIPLENVISLFRLSEMPDPVMSSRCFSYRDHREVADERGLVTHYFKRWKEDVCLRAYPDDPVLHHDAKRRLMSFRRPTTMGRLGQMNKYFLLFYAYEFNEGKKVIYDLKALVNPATPVAFVGYRFYTSTLDTFFKM